MALFDGGCSFVAGDRVASFLSIALTWIMYVHNFRNYSTYTYQSTEYVMFQCQHASHGCCSLHKYGTPLGTTGQGEAPGVPRSCVDEERMTGLNRVG
jgi:hypothetical protein